MRYYIFLFGLFYITSNIYAEENTLWMNPSRDYNFYEIQKSFNDYWKDKNISHDTPKEERLGWKQFKRWEWFWEQRVFPTGEFPNRGLVYDEFLRYTKNNKKEKDNKMYNSDWEFLGPSSAPGGYEGMGRLNCVVEDPDYDGSNNQTIWGGAASGGIWKTTDDGSTWTTNTDDLSVLGIADIVIDPDDSDIMYAATGDGDGYDTYSIGVLKSTNGGSSWFITSFQRQVNQYWVCRRMVMNYDDSDELFVATNGGLYRTTNAGSDWDQQISGSFYDVKYHPTDSDIIYAAKGDEFYRSTDGGDSFTNITLGLPTYSRRFRLAVSPDEEDYVYLLSSDYYGGFNGLYRSTNAGESFSTRSTSPNILSSNYYGSGTGGQGWYDLSMAIDPDNAENVIVGGVNIWKSTDGGANWSIKAYWTWSSVEEVHADHHMMYFADGDRLYSAHDGGLDISTDCGESWDYIGSGLKITQFYRISIAQTDPDIVLCGSQDNSSFLKTSSEFGKTLGTGDGMDQAIDYTDEDIMYTASYYGRIARSTNGGDNWSYLSTPDENGAWVTPYLIDPNNNTTLFAGYLGVWKSTNRGFSWTNISDFSNTSVLKVLHVAPDDSDYIYAGRSGALWKTTNGGSTWSSITLPSTNALVSITTNHSDSDEVWICFSGYSSGQKVYHSTNGGTSWTNISGSLPNVPCNVVIYQDNSNNRIWLGTDIGVWYRNDDDSDWEDYNDELPNVICNDMEIYEASDKLRLGTYGRGLWEVDLISNRPDAPELSSPSDESTDQDPDLTLSWEAVTDVNSYDLQVSTQDDFSSLEIDINTSNTYYEITDLEYETEFFWRVRSISDEDIESYWSDVWGFTTEQDPDLCILLSEGFENISIPTDWTYNYIYGEIDWSFGVYGGIYGNPATAYNGDYNARFYYGSTDGYKTQLITPLLDISGCSDDLVLEFYEARVEWYGDQDELFVKYKYEDDDDWTLLSSYTEESEDWTFREIDLSSINDDFYLCFEAEANYGYGVCLDDVLVYGQRSEVDLSSPNLVSPNNNSTNLAPKIVEFDWTDVSDADFYELQISTTNDFSTTTFNSSITDSEYSNYCEYLDHNETYYWRVRSKDNGDNTSDWSNVWNLSTAQCSTPELSSPADGSEFESWLLEFQWDYDVRCYSYNYQTIQIATDEEFNDIVYWYSYDNYDSITLSHSFNGSSYLDIGTLYYWRIVNRCFTSCNLYNDVYSEVWSFTTPPPPLDPPDLISPTDEATEQNTSLTLDWNSSIGATNYDLELSTSSDFTTTIMDVNTTDTEYDVSGLDGSTAYYWRVRAIDGDRESDWSSVWSFTTKLLAPELSSPTDGSEELETSLTLDWNSSIGATNYDLELSTSSDFTTTVMDVNTTDTEYDVSGLDGSTAYYWRVRAIDGDRESDWSSVWSFETEITELDPPILVSPSDDATGQNTFLTLDWNIVTDATGYDVQLSTSSDFTTIEAGASTTDTEYDVSGLDGSTAYYWRVRAIDGDRESDWSSVWSFETEITELDPPILVSPSDDATGQNTFLTLDWNIVTDATGYDVQLSTSSDFTTIEAGASTTDTEYDISGLDEYSEYYWRVQATYEDIESDWSSIWSFETEERVIQECPWTYTSETGSNATIIVQTSIEPTIDDRDFVDGDAIGAFFTDDGTEVCAGYGVWDGNNMAFSVWGDDQYTTEKDGFSDNEDYIFKAWDAQNGEAIKAIFTVSQGNDYYTNNGISFLGSFSALNEVTQTIDLSSSWSIVSSYVEPDDLDIESIMVDIEDDLLICKNGTGDIYMPSLDINTLGNWNIYEGYKIYMMDSKTLEITGKQLEPTDYIYYLDDGWQMISYIRTSLVDVEIALEAIEDNMLICKNGSGDIYMPSLDINNLGNMEPGEGYKLYMTSNDELQYPSNSSPKQAVTGRSLTPKATYIKPDISKTGNEMTLIIETGYLQNGSEIGVWTKDNVLVGSGKVHEDKAAITIWGDNDQTEIVDGAKTGETLKVIVFDQTKGICDVIEVVDILSLNTKRNVNILKYSSDDIILCRAVDTIKHDSEILLSIRPNPTTGETTIEYLLPEESYISIKLFSITGEMVETISETDKSKGFHTMTYNVSKLSSGVYNLQMVVAGFKMNRLLVVRK